MSQTENYDPNAPEGDTSVGGQYFSRKDAKWVALGVVIFFLASIPVYIFAKDARDKTICTTNMKEIYTALGLYAESNDDRYPPLYETGEGNNPNESNGAPVTWVTQIAPLLSKRATFVCPAASEAEKAYSANPIDPSKPIPSTYGFYAAYGGVARNQIDNPDRTILLAETSNGGSERSYDPMPFKGPGGVTLKNDGFVIGWDNSNEGPDPKTKSVTRLAWRGTENGRFDIDGGGRHSAGLIFIFASGEKLDSKGSKAALSQTQWLPGKFVLDMPWGNPILKSQH